MSLANRFFQFRMRTTLTVGLLLTLLSPAANADGSLFSADIDRMIQSVWQSKEIEPVGVASDSEFLRRVSFDLIGLPPSYQEAEAFLESSHPDKRSQLVSELLDSDDYGVHRSSVLMAEIIEGRVIKQRLPMESFEKYFETSFNGDKPYDQMVREMVLASGDTSENGATYMVVTHQANPEDLTGTVSRLFNGTQLRCVQCHDDKFGDWKQTDFWGTAAFFARTDVRPNEKMGNRLLSVVVSDRKKGEIVIPEGGVTPSLKGLPKEERRKARREMLMAERRGAIAPAFLGDPVTVKKNQNRREVLARLVTSPENTLFARSTVNRVWSEMFGKGLIEPVDDIHEKDAGEWEPLLQTLSEDFARSGHSLKRLYGLLAMTETYQRTSESEDDIKGLEASFARSRMRPHSPEVLLNAILRTSHAEKQMAKQEEKMGRKSLRNRVLEKFSFAFGNDEGNRVLSFEATIPQALMMMNDPIIERAIAPAPGSLLMDIAQETKEPQERIRLLYLAALSREPNEHEMNDAMEYLSESLAADRQPVLVADIGGNTDRRKGGRSFRNLRKQAEPYQDVLWALMNTSEFLYNH